MTRLFRRLAAVLTAVLAAAVGVAVVAPVTGVAHADGFSLPLPCERTIRIGDDRGYEGNIPTSGGFYLQTLFAFAVTSTGCNRGGTVSYQTVSGTAETSDYVSTSGTLTFTAGDASTKTIYVWVVRDGSPGSDEYFWVHLTWPSDGIVVDDSWGKGTIINDDYACVAPPDIPPDADWHCME